MGVVVSMSEDLNMMNFGIRYDRYGTAWIPDCCSLCEYLDKDMKTKEYGKGHHQFAPKEYAVEVNRWYIKSGVSPVITG